MPDLLLDTDVIVDQLRGARRLPMAAAASSYSVITRCELYAGRDTDETRVDALLLGLFEISVDREIAQRAGRLQRAAAIRTPDALVAATALERGLELVTRNRRDFEGIRGLRVRDPSSL